MLSTVQAGRDCWPKRQALEKLPMRQPLNPYFRFPELSYHLALNTPRAYIFSGAKGGMAKRDIVVIGASAGGIVALRSLLAALPEGFPASVFITIHTSPTGGDYLGDVLGDPGNR